MNELFDARGGIWLVAAGAASAAITWIAIRYARRHQLLDLPGQRRSHAAPTPRGGGIGIAVVALLVAALALLVQFWPSVMSALLAAVAGANAASLGGDLLFAGMVLLATVWSINLHNF